MNARSEGGQLLLTQAEWEARQMAVIPRREEGRRAEVAVVEGEAVAGEAAVVEDVVVLQARRCWTWERQKSHPVPDVISTGIMQIGVRRQSRRARWRIT